MKIIIKNSSMVIDSGILSYKATEFCKNKGVYKMETDSPVLDDTTANWGYSGMIDVTKLKSISVACSNKSYYIPGVLYFSDNNITSFISVQYSTGEGIINKLNELVIPSNAKYCILQTSYNEKFISDDDKVVIYG